MGQLLADPVAEARQQAGYAAEEDSSGLDPAEQKVVTGRLESLRGRIDAEPKSRRWRMRNQVSDKVRWYAEPEQEQPGGD